MLERATICSQHGARHARSLSLTRSRRLLHSTFWDHGAGDINLPSWWVELLCTPPYEKPLLVQRFTKSARGHIPTLLKSSFILDFLYPPKALSLARRILAKDSTIYRSSRKATSVIQGLRHFASAVEHVSQGEAKIEEPEDGGMMHMDNLELDQRVSEALKGYGVLERSEELPKAARVFRGYDANNDLQTLAQRAEWYRRLWNNLKEHPEYQADVTAMHDDQLPGFQGQLKGARLCAESFAYRYLRFVREKHLPPNDALWSSDDFARVITACYIARHPRRYILKLGEMAAGPTQALYYFERALQLGKESSAVPAVLGLTFSFQFWEFGRLALEKFRAYHDEAAFWAALSNYDSDSLAKSILEMLENIQLTRRLRRAEAHLSHSEKEVSPLLVHTIEHFLHRSVSIDFEPMLLKKIWNALVSVVEPSNEMYDLGIKQLISPSSSDSKQAVFTVLGHGLWKRTRSLEGFKQDRQVLNNLLDRLCKINHTGAREVFHTLRELFGPPNRKQYELALRNLSYHGHVEEYMQMLGEFRKTHRVGNLNTFYAQLLSAYGRNADLTGAKGLFDSIQSNNGLKASDTIWNAMIGAHLRSRDYEGALAWASKMQEQGMSPNVSTFKLMIRAYCSKGDAMAAENFIFDLAERGIQVDASMVTSLVFAHVQDDDLDQAEKVLFDATAKDIPGDKTEMWNTVLYAHAIQGNVTDMYFLHKKMGEKGVPENNMTYAALIQGLAKVRQPNLGMKIITDIMAAKNLVPTSFHFAIIIAGYIRTREYDLALNVASQMERSNVEPDFSTKTLLVRAAAGQSVKDTRDEIGQVHYEEVTLEAAEKLLDYFLNRESLSDISSHHPILGTAQQSLGEVYASNYFETLIVLYGQKRSLEKVTELFDRYLTLDQSKHPTENPTIPPIRMLSALMLAHRNENNHAEVERCWNLALEKAQTLACRIGVDPTTQPNDWVLPSRRFLLHLPLIHYMISLVASGRFADLDPLVTSLLLAGFALDSKCWNYYIQSLCHFGRYEDAFELAEHYLMHNFPGWPRWAALRSPRSYLKRVAPERRHLKAASPSYRTLVVLARGYMDFRARYAFSGGRNEKLAQLAEAAPKTVRAVTYMPRIDDEEQLRYLRGR
ncbi:MAG: hypothetical protein LQ340_005155 [Diploschistes diacapsis]|nr:MAG: hypothetical protein LQ340_005155 [Diploschistes diacapsis]